MNRARDGAVFETWQENAMPGDISPPTALTPAQLYRVADLSTPAFTTTTDLPPVVGLTG